MVSAVTTLQVLGTVEVAILAAFEAILLSVGLLVSSNAVPLFTR